MKQCERKKCQKDFEPKKPKQRFCSDKCRVYHRREEGIKKVETEAGTFWHSTQQQFLEKMDAFEKKLEQIVFAGSKNAYDAPKLASPEIQDEPLSFAKLKQETAGKKGYGEYAALLSAAEDLGQLEAVGRQIKSSDLLWKEKQMLQNLGQQIAKNKFLD